ncbi:hypothetical protein Mpsy_2340 [Methanolobus psychrophilus R15]|nr:hypothetical protein Mpsy_2340 [Methanolobus psychrophilus R15]
MYSSTNPLNIKDMYLIDSIRSSPVMEFPDHAFIGNVTDFQLMDFYSGCYVHKIVTY